MQPRVHFERGVIGLQVDKTNSPRIITFPPGILSTPRKVFRHSNNDINMKYSSTAKRWIFPRRE
jgi:hypothetical protein